MSLSARERILKLRETEFKLNKLQNDLLSAEKNGKGATSAFMSRFLAHHKELMSLPGRTRNSIPYRYGIEAPKRYIEVEKSPRLTLPPHIDSKSSNRLRPFKEPEVNQYEKSVSEGTYGSRHPSLALKSLISELEDQTEKMAIAFPKIDRVAFLKKSLRSVQPLNSMRYVNQDGPNNNKKKKISTNKTVKAYKAYNNQKREEKEKRTAPKKSTAVLYKTKSVESSVDELHNKDSGSSSKSKLGVRWMNQNNEEVSVSGSRSDMSVQFFQTDLRMPFAPLPSRSNAISSSKTIPKPSRSQDLKELKETLAYAIESSNLMGVILPPKRGGPTSWSKRPRPRPSLSRSLPVRSSKDSDDDEQMSAKDALQLLKRRDRELPERNKFLDKPLKPHQRGLIGVEISSFEPQCAVFYRDRNGNYNPHLKLPSIITDNKIKFKTTETEQNTESKIATSNAENPKTI